MEEEQSNGLPCTKEGLSLCSAGLPVIITRSSAVAERPHDASCLSVVSFNIPTVQFFLLLVTAASDLLVHKILLNSVLLSHIVSCGVCQYSNELQDCPSEFVKSR